MSAVKIPLVVYRNQVRTVIGEAFVNEDGRVIARITDDTIREFLSRGIAIPTAELTLLGIPGITST